MDKKVYLIESPQLEKAAQTARAVAQKMGNITTDIAAAYNACDNKGATLPQKKNSANLAGTIDTIPSGSSEAPTLYAPTISRTNDTVSITNPSTNGGYVSIYKIYNGNTVIKEQSTTSFSIFALGIGTYELYVVASGLGFKASPKSNRINAAVYSVTKNLENLTANNNTAVVLNGLSYTVTLSPASGYYLPEYISVTMGGTPCNFDYDSYTGVVTVYNASGNIVITATADTALKLRRPQISLAGSVLSIVPPRYAENTKVYVDGTLAQTYTGTEAATFDLSGYSVYGIYDISVQSEAAGYISSDSVGTSYNVGPTIQMNNGIITILNIISGVNAFNLYVDGRVEDFVNYDGSAYWSLDMSNYEGGSIQNGKHSVELEALGSGSSISANRSNPVTWFCGAAPVYGVNGLYGNSSPQLVRTDDAIGMSYVINTSTGAVDSDFDDVFPWNEASLVENAAGKFLKFPTMYFRVGADVNMNLTDVAVSAMPGSTGNWYEVPSFMIGCYCGTVENNRLVSKSGFDPANYRTRANFRSLARANGDEYFQYDLYHHTVLLFLWWIEFANRNSQSIMRGRESGSGTAGGSSRRPTGGTDGISTPSGFETVYGQMRWHGIEDFTGNMWRFVDGICTAAFGESYYVTNDPSKFADTKENMEPLAYKAPAAAWCISAYGWDPDHPFLCMPCEVVNNSSYNTYFCDQINLTGSSNPVLYVGSGWSHGSTSYGLSYCYGNSVGSSLSHLGARLLKVS